MIKRGRPLTQGSISFGSACDQSREAAVWTEKCGDRKGNEQLLRTISQVAYQSREERETDSWRAAGAWADKSEAGKRFLKGSRADFGRTFLLLNWKTDIITLNR